MCVAVTLSPGTETPSLADLELMHGHNPDGAGIAWPSKRGVEWIKGIKNMQKLQGLLERAPRPCFLHFRLASAGGSNLLLTHPFPVELNSPLAYRGRTKRQVMMHNGHWNGFQDARKILGKELPRGLMSDSRLMAHLAARNGAKVFKWLSGQGQKIATMDKDGTMTLYGAWEEHKGNHYSNMYWNRPVFDWKAEHGMVTDWKQYLEKSGPVDQSACELAARTHIKSQGVSGNGYYDYETWEDTYVPKSLHRMTEAEIVALMQDRDEGGEG